jgi:5-methylcytosine-specific restriction endonuclease McrA
MESETKICGRCHVEKPLDEFGFRYPKLGIRHSWCKDCFVAYKRAWYERNREKHIAHVRRARDLTGDRNQLMMWQYLAVHPCVECGERDPVVLQFDHLRDKRNDVAYMCGSGFAWSTILEEIAKCQVLCANCHARKTARERGIWERKHMTLHMPSIWETDRIHNCDLRAVSSMDRAVVF